MLSNRSRRLWNVSLRLRMFVCHPTYILKKIPRRPTKNDDQDTTQSRGINPQYGDGGTLSTSRGVRSPDVDKPGNTFTSDVNGAD